ncbi:MAG: hypothetical protein N3D82_03880 [Ignisphaera sp.]|nr:hypothetical protein [Ignisphaera sp.]MCX8168147.1 hypothetical protein [Ignisphaera sp.]MDW8085213.1 hypothetical protein [Ignisphaera sp.]
MPRTGKGDSDKEPDKEFNRRQDLAETDEVRARGKKSSTPKRRYVDTEGWVEKHLNELIEALGLQFLELSNEEYMKIATSIVDMIRGESSTLDLDVIVRRFKRNITFLYPIVATMILELRDVLTDVQIEFIVNNIGEAILTYAPRLYRELVTKGRNDLIDRLRECWDRYWIAKRYPVLPVSCPICKFNALMPDLTCAVCGSTVSEKNIKEHVNFIELLKEFIKNYSTEEIMKAVNYGYVYLSSIGLKPPTDTRDPLDIEVVLSSNEKEFIKSLIEVHNSKWS